MIGRRIRMIREALGVEVPEFSNITGIANPVIYTAEEDRRKVGLIVTRKLCTALGVSLSWLVLGAGDPLLDRRDVPRAALPYWLRLLEWRNKYFADLHGTEPPDGKPHAMTAQEFRDRFPQLRGTAFDRLISDPGALIKGGFTVDEVARVAQLVADTPVISALLSNRSAILKMVKEGRKIRDQAIDELIDDPRYKED